MTWWYAVREGFANLRRARGSVWVSIITIALSLWLVGIFLIGAWNGWQVLQKLKDKLEMEVFLLDTVKVQDAYHIRKSLLKIPGVDSVKFVSKYDALQKFQKEFGENIIDILGENPLQSSFRIRLKKSFHTRVRVQKIMGQIKKLSGVEDVTYRYDLLKIIEKYLKIFFGIGISLGAIIAFISLLLISNTVRMAIVSRSEEIKVMRLLGATPQFIRRPFLVQGFYLGVFGGILSLFLLLVVIWAARHELSLQILNAREIFGFVMGWGIILGVLGSWRAIGKYLKEEI